MGVSSLLGIYAFDLLDVSYQLCCLKHSINEWEVRDGSGQCQIIHMYGNV